MAETHIISALTEKRAELAGLLAHHRKQIAQISKDLKIVDTTIKMFEPDYRIHAIKPKRYQRKNSFFKHGEAHKAILDILRKSGKPLSTNDIASLLMSIRSIDSEHEKALRASILTTLHGQRKNGIVESTGRDQNGGCLWSIVD
jgi:hypothetical protein